MDMWKARKRWEDDWRNARSAVSLPCTNCLYFCVTINQISRTPTTQHIFGVSVFGNRARGQNEPWDEMIRLNSAA